MRVLLVVCVTLSLCLVGCGGGGQSSQTVTSAPSTQSSGLQLANGNWLVAVTPKSDSQHIHELTIGFSVSTLGATWSSFGLSSDGCMPSNPPGTKPTFTIFLTGPQTWTISGAWGLVSVDATLTGSATQITGTYVLHGGCAEGETGTVTALLVPILTGTWKGQVNGNGPTVTLNLTQVQSQGFSKFEGSATIEGSSCMNGGTISAQRSSLAGNQFGLDIIGSATSVNVGGILQPPTYDREIKGLIGNASDTCSDLHGAITLTKQ